MLYRRVLGLFREREADFVQRFRAARAAGDADAAMRAAHDLKGEAGDARHARGGAGRRRLGARLPGGRTATPTSTTWCDEVSGRLGELMAKLQELEGTRTSS